MHHKLERFSFHNTFIIPFIFGTYIHTGKETRHIITIINPSFVHHFIIPLMSFSLISTDSTWFYHAKHRYRAVITVRCGDVISSSLCESNTSFERKICFVPGIVTLESVCWNGILKHAPGISNTLNFFKSFYSSNFIWIDNVKNNNFPHRSNRRMRICELEIIFISNLIKGPFNLWLV